MESRTRLATKWPYGPCPSNTPQNTVSSMDPKSCGKSVQSALHIIPANLFYTVSCSFDRCEEMAHKLISVALINWRYHSQVSNASTTTLFLMWLHWWCTLPPTDYMEKRPRWKPLVSPGSRNWRCSLASRYLSTSVAVYMYRRKPWGQMRITMKVSKVP